MPELLLTCFPNHLLYRPALHIEGPSDLCNRNQLIMAWKDHWRSEILIVLGFTVLRRAKLTP